MSKSTTQSRSRHVRHTLTGIVTFLASVVAAFTAAPAAFAMRPVPPAEVVGGTSRQVPTAVTHSGGIVDWQIALIVAGAVLLAAIVVTATARIRSKVRLAHVAI